MKRHHLSIFLLLLLSLTASAQGDSINLGNCTKNVVLYEPLDSKTAPGGSALFYPAEAMQKYAGCQITNIVLFPSNWRSVTSLQVFISRSLTEPFDYTQEVKLDHGNWVNVPLNTPYHIDGGDIYIGFMIKGTSNLVYTKPKEKGTEYICLSPSKGWQPNNNGYSAALYAVVRAGKDAPLPTHNARIKDVKFPPCARLGQSLPVQATIGNMGLSTIESLTVKYNVGDRSYQEEIKGLDIPAAAEQTLTLTCPAWEEEGEHAFSITITSVNGSGDADMSDNTSPQVQMICREHFTQRRLLLEAFSTERCTECPQAHEVLHEVCADNDRIIELGHHAGFYDDAYTLPESQAYEWFYKPSVLYAPAVMLDRSNFHNTYPTLCDAETPVGQPEADRLTTLLDYALSVPAYASVELEAITDEAQRTATLTVSGTALLPCNGDTRLFVFVSEDSIHSTSQAGAAAGFYHRHVARRSLTPTWGTPIATTEGYRAEYTLQIPETWNMNRLRAVAFVANYNADNRNECRVLNTAATPLCPQQSTGITHTQQAPIVLTRIGRGYMLPQGAHLQALHSVNGQALRVTADGGYIHMGHLAPGTYLLIINHHGQRQTCKLIYQP